MASYTLKMDPSEAPDIRRFLLQHGFEITDVPHTIFGAKGPGCVVNFYKSGKLLLQGKEADTWRGLMGDVTAAARPYHSALSKHPKPQPEQWIGTDEAGKGDYFGPLVITGVAIKRKDLEILQTLGVDDSKAIADGRVQEMVLGITALCEVETIIISAAKYNQLHPQMRSVNRMLAWGHGKAIEALLERTDASWVLIDRFAQMPQIRRGFGPLGLAANIDAWPKAEEDPAVAAASIIARAAYLRSLASLSKRYGLQIKSGAGAPTLAVARRFVSMHGKEALNEVAKVHFATTDQI